MKFGIEPPMMVAPDRDTPGNMAVAWHKPILIILTVGTSSIAV